MSTGEATQPQPQPQPQPPPPPPPPQTLQLLPPPGNDRRLGGYVFECHALTIEECFVRGIFGLPPSYINSVSRIIPGLPLFLYNHSTGLIHGIFKAASYGGVNIDPGAWPHRQFGSRFPAQVRVRWWKTYPPVPTGEYYRPAFLTRTNGTNVVSHHQLTVSEVRDIAVAFCITRRILSRRPPPPPPPAPAPAPAPAPRSPSPSPPPRPSRSSSPSPSP